MKKTSSAAMSVGIDDSLAAEDDMRTLMRAEEIRKDPKRLAAAKAMAKKKLAEIQAVADTSKT